MQPKERKGTLRVLSYGRRHKCNMGQKDKGQEMKKETMNPTTLYLQVSIFPKLTLNFQNYVACADFFQSTLNGHNYFLRTTVAA